MPDDEPLDDARAVAMAGGAAAARVVETLAREAREGALRQQDRQAVQQAQQARALATGRHYGPPNARDEWLPQDAQDARRAADTMMPRATLGDPDTWHKTGGEPVTPAQAYTLERFGLDAGGLTKAEASKIIGAPEDGRAQLAEALRARTTADAMSGKDPALAASRGTAGRGVPVYDVPYRGQDRGR